MPSAVFAHTIRIATPIEDVWAALQDPATWEQLGPVQEVWDPVHDPEGVLLGYRWSTRIGGREYRGSARTVDHRPPTCFVIDLEAGEMAGTITAELASDGEITDVAVSLEVHSRGMMSTLLFPAIHAAIASGFPQQVEDLAGRIAGK